VAEGANDPHSMGSEGSIANEHRRASPVSWADLTMDSDHDGSDYFEKQQVPLCDTAESLNLVDEGDISPTFPLGNPKCKVLRAVGTGQRHSSRRAQNKVLSSQMPNDNWGGQKWHSGWQQQRGDTGFEAISLQHLRWRVDAAQNSPAQQSQGNAWRPRGRRTAKSWHKPQCQFLIGIDEDPIFRVTRRLLGVHGQNMKGIAEQTGAKLRLRGTGSRFLEGPERQESTDPLMLCVSAPDMSAYVEATRLVRQLLENVYRQYQQACKASGRPASELGINMHEGPRPGSF